jgi:cytochrome c biogenesis protein CcdA
MKALRILAKMLLFPLSLVLTIFVAVAMFIVERFAGILNIISGIIFLGALAAYAQYLFGWPIGTAGEATTLQLAIFATVFAFILSPYGLPTLAVWILAKLENLNDAIKAI